MSVTSGDRQATFAATLVDEWVRCGLRHAVICPGSRSSPLNLALAARAEVALHVRLDERSACFFAIGLWHATEAVPLISTTSGTAAAELHAGVIEALHQEVPLLVCTADRPPRLHKVGAPQTVEQGNLFGPAVVWTFEPGLADTTEPSAWRALGARAYHEASGGLGPVHLNLAFDEPLVAEPGPLPPGRPGGAPWRVTTGPASGSQTLGPELERWAAPGVLVAGRGAPDARTILRVAEHLGWPVLADPSSGCRLEHANVCAAADSFLADPALSHALLPSTVLLIGAPWASRNLNDFVELAASRGAEVIAVGSGSADRAPAIGELCLGDPKIPVEGLLGAPGSAPKGWVERWKRAEEAAQRAIDDLLAEPGPLAWSEPAVARRLFGLLHRDAIVYVSSSLPIRDLERYGKPRSGAPRVLANRGANGIDGVVSSALGVAAGSPRPVVCVVGDLAFLHDLSALATLRSSPEGSCTLVVMDNGGGGIFNFLPQARSIPHERFEVLFGTPPAVSVPDAARGLGVPVAQVTSCLGLEDALSAGLAHKGASVVVAKVPDRQANAELHARIDAAAAAAARSALAL
ncbi:MAG: 2-succinyl-5-enolpyruvyl-6-hydroxy-3-cyclohexene-1-carboxylic-acid synthase [Acidimicrobiales bacterium]